MFECEKAAHGVDEGFTCSVLGADGIPAGFEIRPDGIYEASEREETDALRLCSRLTVTAAFEDPAGRNRGRVIEFEDDRGRRHTVSIFSRELEADLRKVRRDLADRGFWLRHGPKAHDAVLRLLRDWKVRLTLTATDRFGWTDRSCRSFVLSEGCILGDGRVHFTGETGLDPSADGLSSGTLATWRDEVAALCAGNPLLIIAVSLAFAAPLVELLNEDGGGLHLRGASSRGKSSVLKAAASVWGHPDRAGSWRATANALEGAALGANSMLLALDEIGEIAGSEIFKAVYLLGNGIEKRRATRVGPGGVANRWRVAILSTGEDRIADRIAEDGRLAKAGNEVRLIDVEADGRPHGAFDQLRGSSHGAAFSGRLKTASRGSHGTAGEAFVRMLLDRGPDFQEAAKRVRESMAAQMRDRNALGADDQAMRVARQLALIGLAGELATKHEITGWKKGDALSAALLVLRTWLSERARRHASGPNAALTRLRTFLQAEAHGFVERGSDPAASEIVQQGWKDEGFYYLTSECWKEIYQREARKAARNLVDAGYLLPGEEPNLSRHAPSGIPDRPRLYWVRADILDEKRPPEAGVAA
ncbi:MAG TPA: DUF927 domain-containing protein [Albidovulum sp.]|uniref:DUF927 domain-containing protein n=1 Tax=Albidovulum sp. TaxID=1872424 RepID=UPI002BA2AAD9|nr:DUF927 domain-containing protein [Albidovulum sp.]